MSNPNLVDAEPGGESTQYESIKTFTEPPAKATGQLGGNSQHTQSELRTTLNPDDEGDKDADENDEEMARAGRFTTKVSGQKDLNLEPQGDAAAAKSRREQGYGPGSGIGG